MLNRSEAVDRLFDTFLALQSREECYAYFEDLCTVKEVQDMAGRLQVAIRLDRGDSYSPYRRRRTPAPPPSAG